MTRSLAARCIAPASVLLGLVLMSCATSPQAQGGRRCGPEALAPHQVAFRDDEDPSRPSRVLNDWLDFLGPQRVRERKRNAARVRGWSEYRRDDIRIEWRAVENGVEVRIPEGDGDLSRALGASLALAMWAKGVQVDPEAITGCCIQGPLPAGSPAWADAVREVFRLRGYVSAGIDVGTTQTSESYGRAGDPQEWWVVFDNLDGGTPTLDVFHDARPFDVDGEHALFLAILERMGTELDESRLLLWLPWYRVVFADQG